MTELKRFLNPLSPYLRFLYTAFTVVPACFILFFVYLTIVGMLPPVMLLMPVLFFGGFGAFMFWLLVRGSRAFDKWWAGLDEAQREEIEQDFRQGSEVSYYMIEGPRYAYLRWSCRVVPYDRIGNIDYVRGKSAHCYMHIEVAGEKKVFLDLPSFREGQTIHEALLCHMTPTEGMEA